MSNTINRVEANTAEEITRRIERQTEWMIQYYAEHPEQIGERLEELDREWDIERVLEANAASISLISVLLGLAFSRRFFILPAIVGGFLLQHTVHGWCPPIPLFRRMGIRTQGEIERERYALKLLRGDFKEISGEKDAQKNPRRLLELVKS